MENKKEILQGDTNNHRKKEKLQRHLAQVELNLQLELSKQKELGEVLEKEEQDVTKLEKTSITTLFYQLLGTKEQRLEKEQAEYLAARLKYSACTEMVQRLEKEAAHIKEELTTLEGKNLHSEMQGEEEKQGLSKEKFFNKEAAAWNIVQIEEAIEIGKKGWTALNVLVDILEKVKQMKTREILDIGYLNEILKHEKIEEGREKAYEVKQLLRRFEIELEDIILKEKSSLQGEITSFKEFVDYLFDGLISDWIIQGEVTTSLNHIIRVQQQVQDIIVHLEETKKEIMETKTSC